MVNVWDPFVRLFHWLLVLAVITQLLSAETFTTLHFYDGYFIAVLLILRIVWGFVGSKHARFSDFIYPPKDVFAYLKGLVRRQPINYVGHNPAGGAMVMALLLVLCLTAFAGMKTLGTLGEGPLADATGQWMAPAYADSGENDGQMRPPQDQHDGDGKIGSYEIWKTIHVSLVSVLMILVVLHLCGVIASSYMHKENLVLAMVTGKKVKK